MTDYFSCGGRGGEDLLLGGKKTFAEEGKFQGSLPPYETKYNTTIGEMCV